MTKSSIVKFSLQSGEQSRDKKISVNGIIFSSNFNNRYKIRKNLFISTKLQNNQLPKTHLIASKVTGQKETPRRRQEG